MCEVLDEMGHSVKFRDLISKDPKRRTLVSLCSEREDNRIWMTRASSCSSRIELTFLPFPPSPTLGLFRPTHFLRSSQSTSSL